MTKLDLKALNLKELKELQREVNSAVVEYEKIRRIEVLKELEERAAEEGFTLAELFAESQPRPKKANAASPVKNPRPKWNPEVSYQNPENGAIWSGRGRTPMWILEAKTKGIDISEFAIKNT